MQSGANHVSAKSCPVETPHQANFALGPFCLPLGASYAKVEDGYANCMINVTTRAPAIIAAIVDVTLPQEVTLFELAAGTALWWAEQWGRFGRLDNSA